MVGHANSAITTVNSNSYYFDGTCANGDMDASFSVHGLNLGSASHCSFIGGSANDAAYDIVQASNGIFYIAGGTASSDFPTTMLTNMYNSGSVGNIDNFIVALAYNNQNMIWSTYLGSPDMESLFPPNVGTSIALNSSNVLHLAGCSAAYNSFPLDPANNVPYFQNIRNTPGGETGTVTRFDMAVINANPVGIADFPNSDFVFAYYPNPVLNSLTISNTELSGKYLHYAIYDSNGKRLISNSCVGNEKHEIDVSFLQSGVYIINVSDGTKTFSNKFVKSVD
jgi:hypothetical protein